jgi:putative membrane protein
MNEFSGIDGFLGTRASSAMDMMVLLMALVVAVLGWSIYQVRVGGHFRLHRSVQLALGVALLVAVVLFELDVRFNGWEERSAGVVGGSASGLVWSVLSVHLVFAVFSVLLWPVVIVRAMRNFSSSPRPGVHSAWHQRWARIAAIGMTLTAVSCWAFYWVAFVA